MRNVPPVVLFIFLIDANFRLHVNPIGFSSFLYKWKIEVVAIVGRDDQGLVIVDDLKESFNSLQLIFLIEDLYLASILLLRRIIKLLNILSTNLPVDNQISFFLRNNYEIRGWYLVH